LLTGARLAQDEVNRAGGAEGYRVEIAALDERNAASPGDLAVDPDVVAVVGHLVPDAAPAAAVYRRAGLAWLAAEPIDPGSRQYPLVAGPATVDRLAATAFQAEATGPGVPLGTTLEQCRAGQAGGGGVVFAGAVELLCGLPPDRLAVALDSPAPTRYVICVGGCDAPEIEKWAPGVALDYVAPIAPPAAASPAWARFLANLGGRVASPVYAAVGYDGVDLVVAAARRAAVAGAPDRAGVGRELGRTDLVGALGAYGPIGPKQATAELTNSRFGVLARETEQR
jgi:hypothetical protein